MLRIFVRYNSRHGNRMILNSTDQVYQDCTQNSGHCIYGMFYFHRMCLEKRVKIFMSMTNKFSQILKAVRHSLALHSYLCRVFHKFLPKIHRYTRLCNVQISDHIFDFCNPVDKKGCNQVRGNQKCIPCNPGQNHSFDNFYKSNYSFCHKYFFHTVRSQVHGGQTSSKYILELNHKTRFHN